MEKQNQLTVMPLPQQARHLPARLGLVSEWIAKFATNSREIVNDESAGVLLALWCDAFSDLTDDVLNAAFLRTLRSCRFFPNVADVRSHIDRAQTSAAGVAAEEAWQHVLQLRRLYWNPDMPGGFYRGMPQLGERTSQAARAAGVFRDHESIEALHVWGKKKFVESFIAWGELEQDKFLLPAGEVRDLLEGTAQKLLPASATYEEGRARGLAYAEKQKVLGCNEPDMRRAMRAIRDVDEPRPVFATPDRLALLEKQKAEILARSTPEEIRKAENLRKRA
jgi:hypothetical protein